MLTDAIDILFVALLVYSTITWMRAARAHVALIGIGILGCVYLVARQLGLGLTAWLFQGFFAAFLILIVVLFHTELRHAFERLGLWGMRRNVALRSAPGAVDKLVAAATQLASQHRGALIVLAGRDPLERHLGGGVPLEGILSEPLLLSLFDPHSLGHDGAVVVEGERVRRFGVHLPLSEDHEQLKMRGTRHAAALGLSELTDALCMVVSEETGRISVAVDGVLRPLEGSAALAGLLRRFLDDRFGPSEPTTNFWRKLRGDWKSCLAAAVASGVLWLLVIPGSEVAEESIDVPVVVTNLPPGFLLERVDPPEAEALLSGLRRDFFWIDPDAVRVEVDALLVQLGRRTFRIAPEMVVHPPGLSVKSVQPDKVRIYVREENEPPTEPRAGEPGEP